MLSHKVSSDKKGRTIPGSAFFLGGAVNFSVR